MTHEDHPARLAAAIRKKRAGRSRASALPGRPPDRPPRLGAMQRSLWLAHRLEPESAAYHLVDAYRLVGALDPARLQDALRQVVARHRLLRSTFRRQDDRVVQILDAVAVEAFAIEVFASEVFDEATGEAESVAVREARRPFDLARGPLVRLLYVGDLLVLVLHHILADERSLGVIWRELSEAYTATLQTDPPQIQYDDYVAWAAQHDSAARRQTVDFWRRTLDPPPADLDLPCEVRRHGSPSGRLLTLPLPDDTAEGIRRLAVSTGATPFLVCAFAYQLLLHRLAEQPPAVASPASTRSHPATAEMIGYFINPVVLPADLDEGQSLGVAIRSYSDATRQRLAHAQVAFHDLVEALDLPRTAGRHPIFQTLFVYRRPDPPPAFAGATRLDPVSLDLEVSKFDLTFFATEQDGSFEVAAEFRTDRYDEEGVRGLVGWYGALLADLAAARLDAVVASMSMLTGKASRRLASFASGPELTYELDLLPGHILRVAKDRADHAAVVCDGQTHGYGAMARRGETLAAALASAGVVAGDRVGIFLSRSTELLAAILACHWAGAAYVPLDPTYPPGRSHDLLEDAEVRAVLTTSDLEGRLSDGVWATVRCDERHPERRFHPVTTEADGAAYLLYTSGSTGRPKGVVVTHGNLRRSNAARLQTYGAWDIRPRRFLLLPSFAFDSSVAGLFWVLAMGDTLVLPNDDEASDPRRLVELIAREEVTSLLCVPSLFAALLRFAADGQLDSLDTVIVAGERCPWRLVAEHVERLPHVRLFNEYGPTEATVWASVGEITAADLVADRDRQTVSIGRPIPGVCVDILDPSGRTVPVGVPGHAWVAGETVTAGYWRRPELTKERFEDRGPSRRYATGDRMAWTGDGRLLFLGRVDEQIKLRGVRIEPGEVESALLAWPRVTEAAVVVQKASGTERLVAFIVGAAPAGWRGRLAERLPQSMVPARVVKLETLPRLPNDKVDRRRLQAMDLGAGRDGVPRDDSEPVREVPSSRELALLSLWQGLLGVNNVRLDDNVFQLGAHSLLVAEVALTIERDFGVRLVASDVFQSPTVRELARRIEDGSVDAGSKEDGSQGTGSQATGSQATERYDHLFPIQPAGRGAPFVVSIPHVFADFFATRFRGERPVYGLRGVSLRQEGNLGRWSTMADLGEDLANEICRRFPAATVADDVAPASERGVYLAGYSFGASMAVEAARILEARGARVLGLYLITPMALDRFRLGPLRLKVRGLRHPVHELTAGEALRRVARDHSPLTLQPYRRAWRWLKVQPLRRALCLLGALRKKLGMPLAPSILHADVRAERFRMHKRYRPGIVHAPTVVFNAQVNDHEPGTDAAATWRDHFAGPLTVVETPDPHLGDASVEAARAVILDHLRDLETR